MSALAFGRPFRLIRWQHAFQYPSQSHIASSVFEAVSKAHCSNTVKTVPPSWNCRSRQSVSGVNRFRIQLTAAPFSTSTCRSSYKKAADKNADEKLTESAESKTGDFDLTGDPNKSLFKKFNENLKKYWYVMLPVHLLTSGGYFIAFCYLASEGFSPVPLLEKIGWFEQYLKHIQGSHFGTIAVALIFQKIATPLRYLTTWYTVKVLASRGKLMTSENFFKLIKAKYFSKKL